jgi:hypothetical protein
VNVEMDEPGIGHRRRKLPWIGAMLGRERP